MFFEKRALVARLSPESDNTNKEAYANIAAIPINIQPATGELTALVDGAFGQVFTAFVTYSGVALGDRITVSGANDQYIVRGLKNWNYAPIPHLELVLFKTED